MLLRKYKIIFIGKLVCLILSFILFLIIFISQQNKNDTFAGDIVFILDVSHSMNATDINSEGKNISRLELAKDIISSTLKNNSSNKFGLVLFSQKSNYFIPPTMDQKTFMTYLNNINTNALPAGGTNIYMGLKNFIDNSSTGSVGIILSDLGENQDLTSQTKDIENIKKLFEQKKLTLTVVGEGTIKGDYVRFPSGETINNVIQGRNDSFGKFLEKTLGAKYITMESKGSYSSIGIQSKNTYGIDESNRRYLEIIAVILGILGI